MVEIFEIIKSALPILSMLGTIAVFFYSKAMKVHDLTQDVDRIKKQVFDELGNSRIMDLTRLRSLFTEFLLDPSTENITKLLKAVPKQNSSSDKYIGVDSLTKLESGLLDKLKEIDGKFDKTSEATQALRDYIVERLPIITAGLTSLNDNVAGMEDQIADAVVNIAVLKSLLDSIENNNKDDKHEIREDIKDIEHKLDKVATDSEIYKRLHLNKGCFTSNINSAASKEETKPYKRSDSNE